MDLLSNVSDWLSTGLDYYTKKRSADQTVSLQAKKIDATAQSKMLDLQIAQAQKNANTSFTDLNASAAAPTNTVSTAQAIPGWVWGLVAAVVALMFAKMIAR